MSQNDDDLELKRKTQALNYHALGRPGKSEVVPTKPCLTARELSMAYSPGVAYPCLEIKDNPQDAYKYTNKGNLVGVISNGSAVLGLGNIGALAGKPVMEGKGILFKRFADIDVFDIEINAKTVDEMVAVIGAMEPTFGGINLEDIKAPECFEVERRLREKLKIPVFHDDQHGTAIITGAALLNALEITNKKIDQVKVAFSGAGAAAISCALLLFRLGVKKENLVMCDSVGAIYKGRTEGMNEYKEMFAIETKSRTLTDAMLNADVFVGCSQKGAVNQAMIKSMAKNPIIFAMANPDPEITPEEILMVRTDAIIATGRSDYPNQVNNVLGFPFIFRGALDVQATCINEEMKLAAVHAIAGLAKEIVTEDVKLAYGSEDFRFGKNYIIPKPFDKRVLTRVAPAVAKAAVDTGVARIKKFDHHQYVDTLERRLGHSASFMRNIRARIPQDKRTRLIFTEGTNPKILHALSILREEGIIEPVLIGSPNEIHDKMNALGLKHLLDMTIIEPAKSPSFLDFSERYYKERQRKGISLAYAKETMERGIYFGAMMVKTGQASGMVTGIDTSYSEAFKPVVRVAMNSSKNGKAAGVMILVFKSKILFLADCTAQFEPTAEDLTQIAFNTATLYRTLMQKEPKVAFLSYSSFGSNRTESSLKVSKAVAMTKKAYPNLMVDGELQADVATNADILENLYPFSTLGGEADILIFPDLNSSNIAYKLLSQLGGATPIGPIITPMDYAINIIQRTANVEEIVNMSHLTAIISHKQYQEHENENVH